MGIWMVYAWTAASALLLGFSAVLRLRTNSFDPLMRLYVGMSNAATVGIVAGAILIVGLD